MPDRRPPVIDGSVAHASGVTAPVDDPPAASVGRDVETLTRRNLPHWYRPGAAHFLTFRLAGSLPNAALRKLRRDLNASLARVPSGHPDAAARRADLHKRAFARYDALLHDAAGPKHLGDPRIAGLVARSLRFGDGRWYTLLCYCVMPNHVHAVFVPKAADELEEAAASDEQTNERAPRSPLTRIMHSIKSYTAGRANRVLGRTGPFWQRESYDHWVRDGGELGRIVEYVVHNPVAAGLVEEPAGWRWTWTNPERLAAADDRGGHAGGVCHGTATSPCPQSPAAPPARRPTRRC